VTFESREISDQDGAPIAFYTLQWGATVWNYTSADEDQTITVNGVPTTFTAIACSDSGMTQGGSSNNDMTVTAPYDIPLADLFHSTPPSGEISLTVRRDHAGEDDALIHWKGFVQNVKRDEENAAIQIIGVSILSLFKSSGLRLGWCRGCPHILYDSECKVNPEDFAVTAEIVSMTGNTITVDTSGGNAAPHFTGGYIQWDAAAGTPDRRGIMDSTSDTTFVLLGTTYRLEVGMAVTLYPGCDLTTATCNDKFSNLANYGGFEQMTGVNPFANVAIQ